MILDAAGRTPLHRPQRVATPGRRLLRLEFGLKEALQMARTAPALRHGGRAPGRDGTSVRRTEAGALRPAFGHRMPLSEIVTAQALVEPGHKQGALMLEAIPAGCPRPA